MCTVRAMLAWASFEAYLHREKDRGGGWMYFSFSGLEVVWGSDTEPSSWFHHLSPRALPRAQQRFHTYLLNECTRECYIISLDSQTISWSCVSLSVHRWGSCGCCVLANLPQIEGQAMELNPGLCRHEEWGKHTNPAPPILPLKDNSKLTTI